MRMRKRPNLAPRMEKCAELLIDKPEELAGKWLESFPEYKNIHFELGCGKGRFTVGTAAGDNETMLVAVEKVADAMIIALERSKAAELQNVRFINGDVARLPQIVSKGEVSRIYINFCDPWPKSRDAKSRLTAPGFLRIYADALPVGGQIHFKTDNTPLFDWSITQLENEGWLLSELTHDLHENGTVGIMTDYEAKFCESGLKINRLVATKAEGTLGTAAGEVARIRNASLSDARGFEESTAKHEEDKA